MGVGGMNYELFVVAVALFLAPLGRAAEAQPPEGRLALPLPNHGSEVRKPIDRKLMLVVSPEGDGWDVAVLERRKTGQSGNLLYHSRQWHGPYPSQIHAWHVARNYFPDSRWLCVRGERIEVHLRLHEPKVSVAGDAASFRSGRLLVEWFRRPCVGQG